MATLCGQFVTIHVTTKCMWQSYAPLNSPAAPRMADLGVRGPPTVSVEASARSSKEIWGRVVWVCARNGVIWIKMYQSFG